MIEIQSWDELLEYGADIVLGEARHDMINVRDELVFEIRICGKSWDGYIDFRTAKFVLELQDAFNRIYLNASDPSQSPVLKNLNRNITVKVKIKDGSSLIQVNATEALNRIINTMSGDQITLMVGLAIFCATGYWTIKQVLGFKTKKAELASQQAINTEAVSRLTSTIDKALDVIVKADATRPPRKLVKELEEGDSIVFPDNEKLDSQAAKNRYPKKPRERTQNDYIDDRYTIKAISMDKHPPSFLIDKDGYSFKATAQLNHQDIELLAKDLETALKSGDELIVALQVFISFNKNGIKHAAITGIGEPRKDVKNILDLTTHWS